MQKIRERKRGRKEFLKQKKMTKTTTENFLRWKKDEETEENQNNATVDEAQIVAVTDGAVVGVARASIKDEEKDEDYEEEEEEASTEIEPRFDFTDEWGLPHVTGSWDERARFVRTTNVMRVPKNLAKYRFKKMKVLNPDYLTKVLPFWWDFIQKVRTPIPYFQHGEKRCTRRTKSSSVSWLPALFITMVLVSWT